MRNVIGIFILPYEIDDLEITLENLRKASYYCDGKNEIILDVTMCTSDDMVDWKHSSVPKTYFEDKFLTLSNKTDWCVKYFRNSETIKGCLSHRKMMLETYKDADSFTWLDTDIVFDERTFSYIQNTILQISELTNYFIITPEIVKVWDNTWDCIVNENFLDSPLNYQKTNNPYKDSGLKGEVSIEEVVNQIEGQPHFKFAGGWFSTISSTLLSRVGLPESFGHYGPDDTFIMWASHILKEKNKVDIKQFKMKNLVVCENYKYRNSVHMKNHILPYDRRIEFRSLGEAHFSEELEKIN